MSNLTRRELLSLTAAATLYGCSKSAQNEDHGTSLETKELEDAYEQMNIDHERYPSDEYMSEYVEVTAKAMALAQEKSATQDDIDEAVKEIEACRAKVLDPTLGEPAYGMNEDLEYPSYEDVCNNYQEYIGSVFVITGRVTQFDGHVLLAKHDRSNDNLFAYVYWDESETYGQVAAIRIPYIRYDESINRFFSGRCVLEGLDEDGHPQLVVYDYEAK